MGTPVYPAALKVFTVYNDYTDIIWAVSVNEIHDEVYSIEKVLGINPFAQTPYTTFAGAVQDLYNTKAPISHTHTHSTLKSLTEDDHTEYVLANGSRGFTHPVAGVPGSGNDLVPLHQLQSLGYITTAQAQQMIDTATTDMTVGEYGGPALYGPQPAVPKWMIQGGTFFGNTNGGGQCAVNFYLPYNTCLQAFASTKVPATPGQAYPPYNWIEAQVTLVGCNLNQAVMQFSHDYSMQPWMEVAFTWIAIGS